MNQLGRVLNNLRQLARVAEVDGDAAGAAVLEPLVATVQDTIARVPGVLSQEHEEALGALVAAGVALNALAHRANTDEELPPLDELQSVLAEVEAAVRGVAG